MQSDQISVRVIQCSFVFAISAADCTVVDIMLRSLQLISCTCGAQQLTLPEADSKAGAEKLTKKVMHHVCDPRAFGWAREGFTIKVVALMLTAIVLFQWTVKWRYSQVVRQGIANPLPPVQIWVPPKNILYLFFNLSINTSLNSGLRRYYWCNQ